MQIALDYLITFGWAIVGSLSMAVGVLLCLRLFTRLTDELDEWEELKKGNLAVAVLMASIVIACAWVISAVIRP